MAKLVSIIILNWNGIGFTKKCISSIHSTTTYPNYEIIMVDNGSGKKDIVELEKLKQQKKIDKLILNKTNRGFSAANNQGLKVAKGQYLFFLNNDITVTKNWITNLVKGIEKDGKIGIVGPNTPPPNTPELVYGGGYVDDSGIARHNYNNDEDVGQIGGAALLFTRKLYNRIGGFDEGFSPIYFEETDFCERAHRAGYRVVFVPESKVIHFEGGIIEKQPGKWLYVTMNKNRQRYMLLHFSFLRLLKAVPWEILRIGKNLVNLRLHWLLQSYMVTWKNMPDIMQKRARYKKGKLHAVKAGV